VSAAEATQPQEGSWQDLTQRKVVAIVLVALAAILVAAFVLQWRAESKAITPVPAGQSALSQRQIDKLNAEIKQIRSDTTGSLFWLKLAGVFVTVGAAVGGYLVGQTTTATRRAETDRKNAEDRLRFDHRQTVDGTYHAIVQELSSESEFLRVASAMKLGELLKSPPGEWDLDDERREELTQLTRRILAASLAIEKDATVLKALTIAIATPRKGELRANLSSLDFSSARAANAFWADHDFTKAEFFQADLTRTSFRDATLVEATFYESTLVNAVLAGANCTSAGFWHADLRNAKLSGADLQHAIFDNAKVAGVVLDGATFGDNPDCRVDVADGGRPEWREFRDWIAGRLNA
jgi:hypothetical protein